MSSLADQDGSGTSAIPPTASKKQPSSWLPRLLPRGVLSEDISDIFKVGTLVTLFVQLPNLALFDILEMIVDTVLGRSIPSGPVPVLAGLGSVLALTAPLALSVTVVGLILMFRSKWDRDTFFLVAAVLLFGMALGNQLAGDWGALAPGHVIGEPGRRYSAQLQLLFGAINTIFGYYALFTFWPFLHAIVVGCFLTWAIGAKILPNVMTDRVLEFVARVEEHKTWKRVAAIAFFVPASWFLVSVSNDPWNLFTPENGCYSIQMPNGGQTETTQQIEGSSGLIAHNLAVSSDTTLYRVSYVVYPKAILNRAPNELLESTLRTHSQKLSASVHLTESITMAGKPAISAELSMPDGTTAWYRLLLFETRMYELIVTSSHTAKPKAEPEPDPERFFRSFRITCQTAPAVPTRVATGGWQKTVSAEGGFSVEGPGTFHFKTEYTDNGSERLPIYIAGLTTDRVHYEVWYWDEETPLREEAFSAMIAGGAEDFCNTSGGDVPTVTRITLQGGPGMRVQCHTAAQGLIRFQATMSGRRVYEMLAITPDEVAYADDIERFFNSFTLLKP